MKWLLGLWYSRLRSIDIKILWPICKEKARDLDSAKAAFAVHAFNDVPWKFIGEAETYRIIDGLE